MTIKWFGKYTDTESPYTVGVLLIKHTDSLKDRVLK